MKETVVPLTLESGEQVVLTVQECEPGDEAMTIIIVDDLTCPCCGAGEMDPRTEHLPWGQKRLFIRGFKVDHWSHCLRCGMWFDGDLVEIVENKGSGKVVYHVPLHTIPEEALVVCAVRAFAYMLEN